MARPVKRRRVCGLPRIAEFGPHPCEGTERIELTVDEYEVIRLVDLLGFTQEECAAQMNVARTTVQSIYDSARRKLADVLVNGKMLIVSGGSYEICPQAQGCCGKSCGDHSCRRAHCSGNGCGGCKLHERTEQE
ncbi:MAG: DUF134 domain-containing protein [Butyricicoccus sp.]|nr:DUF134 domain-containing protein [Butyricicoccus sp.]